MIPPAQVESTVVWGLAAFVVVAVVLPYAIAFHRRRRADRSRLDEARALGIDRPVAQYPFVDPASCIGCGACVRACPEGDVLGVVSGVAVVINGLRCVGHGRCADACPVGAIEVGLGDVKGRRDVPILTGELETTAAGIFVAGELTGLALIRNAIEQGQAVIRTIAARRRAAQGSGDPASDVLDVLDVLIVGAGPAGLAAGIAARLAGLEATIVDQGRGLGGTILNFPSRKMVLTRPVELPGGATLDREQYTKEEVLELLNREIGHQQLRVRYGERLESIERRGDELAVRTSGGVHRTRHVVLALGRRGTPRKLGVPGEERSKVMYQLRDAESYRRQRILVVGGGDSAVEAAIGLARQAGNQVTISYRKDTFYRIKRKNQTVIETMIERGRVRAAFESQVEAIDEDRVTLRSGDRLEGLDNDYVFVMIGGEPPFELLRGCGVRFGGEEAPAPPRRGRAAAVAGLLLGLVLGGAVAASAQASPHGDLAIACDQCHTTADWQKVGRDVPFRHDSTGFALSGMHAVAACAECHKNPVFSHVGISCSDCHRDPHSGELGLTCTNCHDSRRWDVRDELFRVHNRTVFPLLAGHARVDCEACHHGQPPRQYALTPTECIACHRADFQAASSPPHTGFSTDCRQCHGPLPNGWRAPGFAHTPRFPLTGAHRDLACAQCHRTGYQGTSADCYSCHQADYQRTRDPNHVAGHFPTTCQVCHSTTSWSGASFDHSATGFVLEGAHRTLDCAQCHQQGYAGTPANCYSCHRTDYERTRDPNHVASHFPTTCQNCHNTTSWSGADFNHASTGFALQGAHATLACSQCHQQGYSGTSAQCYSCHQSDYQGARDPNHVAGHFPTTCQNCHSTTSWSGASFEHSTTGFPLQGAHANLACAQCHQQGYNGTSAQCYSCHQSDYQGARDPNHAASNFPTACQTCHTTVAWTPATFNHNQTAFPLTGAHASTSCQSCHASGYTGTPRQCYACHAADYNRTTDPNHAAAGFPTACQNCHNTTSWDGASFNHDADFFPIYSGAHRGRWTSCSTCHVSPSNYAIFDCTVCHEHSRSRMDSEHREVSNYRYESGACYACHPDGRH